MKSIPSRFRRLDGALADLPLEEPMLLSELDGFLTGIVLCPTAIGRDEWMQSVWGAEADGVAPFEDPADVRWFADAVMARHGEIARDLARGRPQPILDVDERNGEVVWEPWAAGFGEAMTLRADDWATIAAGDDRDAAAAMARLSLLIAIAYEESGLDGVAINAAHDHAAADIIASIRCLYDARVRTAGVPVAAESPARPVKIGRNDPCGCGSGKKSKRCCV